MKAALPLLALLLAALASLGVGAADRKFTTKYDNIDVDEVLSNDRLFNKYTQCLLEEGDSHCTPDAKELKDNIPDAISDDCSKCSEKQKASTDKILKFLVNRKKETWEKLRAKYDPDGKYSAKYEDRVRSLRE